MRSGAAKIELRGEAKGASTLDEAARKRAAVELVARHDGALRRTARRYSLCGQDAEDAYQRALEILLTKAPAGRGRDLLAWMTTVTKHEALAVRRDREQLLGRPRFDREEGEDRDPVARVPSGVADPSERLERREEIARSREAIRALKPAERRALTLLGEGYSYAEIGEITGFSRTKVRLKLFSASCCRLPARAAITSSLVMGSIQYPSPIRSRLARPSARPLWRTNRSKTRISAARTASTPAASVT